MEGEEGWNIIRVVLRRVPGGPAYGYSFRIKEEEEVVKSNFVRKSGEGEGLLGIKEKREERGERREKLNQEEKKEKKKKKKVH
ncbi:hypothetical protein BPOR_0479g00010 [Botrytis porri]|uniref:Uncharacterized protein n=1 Tax=Botrytis porri TaxID=87229 RepID=A0A4Z1KF40_9HELO|nr:hypothetical protein BPOR_0479g00010 [Botrytis porri]